MKLGQLEGAEATASFLEETLPSPYPPWLTLARGCLLAARGQGGAAEAQLDAAFKAHTTRLRGCAVGFRQLELLDAPLMLALAAAFLGLAPQQPPAALAAGADTPRLRPAQGAGLAGALAKAARCCDLVASRAPGLPEPQLLLARCRWLGGDLEGAQQSLTRVLGRQPHHAAALLLQAHVHLGRAQVAAAAEVLERAVAASFSVRESAAYAAAKGAVLLQQGDAVAAVPLLEAALQRERGRGQGGAPEANQLLLALAEALGKAGRPQDGRRLLREAAAASAAVDAHAQQAEAGGRGASRVGPAAEGGAALERGRLAIAEAKLLLASGDATGALEQLRRVPRDSPAYAAARQAAAAVHLQSGDLQAYCAAYEELVQQLPATAPAAGRAAALGAWGDALLQARPDLRTGAEDAHLMHLYMHVVRQPL